MNHKLLFEVTITSGDDEFWDDFEPSLEKITELSKTIENLIDKEGYESRVKIKKVETTYE